MRPQNLTPEQQSSYQAMDQGAAIGIGVLVVEGIVLVTDIQLPIVGHVFLVLCGAGLAISSAFNIRDANRALTQAEHQGE